MSLAFLELAVSDYADDGGVPVAATVAIAVGVVLAELVGRGAT